MRFGDVLLFHTGKDGGPESKVDGYWLFRHKRLFTVALLRFSKGSREAYHSHAFNAVSWVLTGAPSSHPPAACGATSSSSTPRCAASIQR